MYRGTVKSWTHLFCQYILCLKIKADILKFMWEGGKCRIGQKILLWLQNKEIVRFFYTFSELF
jgi:hypothetical protein